MSALRQIDCVVHFVFCYTRDVAVPALGCLVGAWFIYNTLACIVKTVMFYMEIS